MVSNVRTFWKKTGRPHEKVVPSVFWKMMEGECDEEEKKSDASEGLIYPAQRRDGLARLRSHAHDASKLPERHRTCSFNRPIPYIPIISLIYSPQPYVAAATASPLSSTLLFFFP